MIERIGILGVGHLAAYLVPGLLRTKDGPQIILSPRNREKSAILAERFGLAVAGGAAELVEASDVVLLATRPAQAAAAVSGLPWSDGQVLVSLCAGVRVEELAPLVAPADVARAMPVTAAEIGESPTCLYPDLPVVREALALLGPVLALPDEAAFEAATVSAALYGWVHALIGDMAEWSRAAGVPPETARLLVAQTLRGAAGMVQAHPEAAIDDMVQELATPGGITEQGLEVLRDRDAFEAWRAACDAVLARLR